MIDGERLAIMRKAKDFTQSYVARRLGISISHISFIECGRRGISLELLGRLLELYGYDLRVTAVCRVRGGEAVYPLC